MSEVAQLRADIAVLTGIVRDLATSVRSTQKPMGIQEFAERVGLSRWTVRHRIKEGRIVTKGGRIPPSELKKFGL